MRASEMYSEEIRNIIDWHIPMPEKEYMVVVQCSTYNHETYIERALQGFVMQKTTFSFCVLATDDCSTDATPEIISKYAEMYPEIIIPILLKENHMQVGRSRDPYLKPWHKKAKYLAICEGDDYWTDPYKLQKQVDLMEDDAQCVLCFHNAEIHNHKTGESSLFNSPGSVRSVLSTKDLILMSWVTPSASVVFRADFEPQKIKGANGDISLLLQASLAGRIRYMDEVMSVYNYFSTQSSCSAMNSASVLYRKSMALMNGFDRISHRRYHFFILLKKTKLSIGFVLRRYGFRK